MLPVLLKNKNKTTTLENTHAFAHFCGEPQEGQTRAKETNKLQGWEGTKWQEVRLGVSRDAEGVAVP